MTNEIFQEITKKEDLSKLKEVTQGIIGEICWKAASTYVNLLQLEIGAKIPYTKAVLAGVMHGSWILGTAGTGWLLKELSGDLITTINDDPASINVRASIIENMIITALEIRYPELDLILSFDNKYNLVVLPENSHHNFGVPYWTLYTPDNMIVGVGPGSKWSYTKKIV